MKVVSPLRWLHSLVTDRTATIGRMMAIGNPIAVANVEYVSSESGAHSSTAPVASRAAMPMLAISQKPARVSKHLRSSTEKSRVNGMGRGSGFPTRAAVTGSAVIVLMLLLLR